MSGDPASSRLAMPIFSMTCAFMAVIATLYSGDYLLFQMSKFADVYKSLKVRFGSQALFFHEYGVYFWCLQAVVTGLSMTLTLRRPGDRRTAARTAAVLAAALVLAFLTQYAAWGGMRGLIRGTFVF